MANTNHLGHPAQPGVDPNETMETEPEPFIAEVEHEHPGYGEVEMNGVEGEATTDGEEPKEYELTQEDEAPGDFNLEDDLDDDDEDNFDHIDNDS